VVEEVEGEASRQEAEKEPHDAYPSVPRITLQEGLLGLAGGLGKQAAVTSAKKSSESLAEFEEPGVCTLAVVAGPRR